MSEINVKVKRLKPDAVIPVKAHAHDAGLDLVAAEDVVIEPGETVIVPTGIALALPPGYEAQVRPRSGITVKTKLRVQLGTIDANYRGEIGVIVDNIALPSLYINERYNTIGIEYESAPKYIDGTTDLDVNTEQEYTYVIRKGDRIAQLVIQRLPSVLMVEVDELDETDRGDGAFGSTGVNNKEAE